MANQTRTPSAASSEPAEFEITTSRQFEAWLAEQNASLAFTTYQAGKFFILGLKDDRSMSVFNRTLERFMGWRCRAMSFISRPSTRS